MMYGGGKVRQQGWHWCEVEWRSSPQILHWVGGEWKFGDVTVKIVRVIKEV